MMSSAEDVRIRNLCAEEDTTYTYNTNAKLSMLLMKTTNGVVTKYVYGQGRIGEEVGGAFKTYHFDSRGSTVAITDGNGNITDTFEYDTYGKMIFRTGTSKVIFGYNGRDGVVTEDNGLIYMRARYYSPEMRRFINADIIAGGISNAITLNRYAYANGNPVSYVDPFGLSVGSWIKDKWNKFTDWVEQKVVKPATKTVKKAAQTVSKTAKKVVSAVDTKIVKPVSEAAIAVGNWFEDAGEWLNKNARNKDGSYALHDNQRFNRDAFFHEQILAFAPSTPSWNWSVEDFSVGLGSLSVDAMTGGWEGEHANFSLLDFGHAEAGLELKNGKLKVGAMASIWSPSFSVNIFGVNVEIGAEVGAVGGAAKGQFSAGKKEVGFSIAGGVGFSFRASW